MIVVAGALIVDGALLVAQRRHPPELAGRWELPGGKVDDGETDAAALARELAEELGITVNTVYSRKFKIREKLVRIVGELDASCAAAMAA